jgi:hypothetical protein
MIMANTALFKNMNDSQSMKTGQMWGEEKFIFVGYGVQSTSSFKISWFT